MLPYYHKYEAGNSPSVFRTIRTYVYRQVFFIISMLDNILTFMPIESPPGFHRATWILYTDNALDFLHQFIFVVKPKETKYLLHTGEALSRTMFSPIIFYDLTSDESHPRVGSFYLLLLPILKLSEWLREKRIFFLRETSELSRGNKKNKESNSWLYSKVRIFHLEISYLGRRWFQR